MLKKLSPALHAFFLALFWTCITVLFVSLVLIIALVF